MKKVKQFWEKGLAEKLSLILGPAGVLACILVAAPAVAHAIIGALSLAVVMAMGGICGMLIHEGLK